MFDDEPIYTPVPVVKQTRASSPVGGRSLPDKPKVEPEQLKQVPSAQTESTQKPKIKETKPKPLIKRFSLDKVGVSLKTEEKVATPPIKVEPKPVTQEKAFQKFPQPKAPLPDIKKTTQDRSGLKSSPVGGRRTKHLPRTNSLAAELVKSREVSSVHVNSFSDSDDDSKHYKLK